jgi:hypothetical protein
MASSPAGRRRPRLRLRVLAIAIAVVAVAGCGSLVGTEPPPTPTDFPGLTGRMKAAGVVVDDWVSGDAGCTDPDLVPASISFSAHGLDQAEPVRMRLYVFRNRDAWERHRDAVGPCAQSWVTDPETYEEIQESPYVLASQGPWAPSFEAAVRSVLTAAAGTGG